ncbi:MAG: 3-deoxy-8-phosphooctulonate synthase [Paracoccus sp. (in: a-proteobacteria)]|jgi:2-dehydro-3-deoxyphosphooctonate aldolase (KDO 8-P synthase)|uniref:3-deoxy-8-phosphooctulonate synthase n=1 Tax=unclassified Paracoccus (in: a-proteobacteria) TaxID=2688777 RepID=UPI000C552841|nr:MULTISPECIES: 3-deoxy-8-phosphooctulonate synthase [unclassified Paracoccus (in: a-proteobacteria)]MAN55564.1 3-deoxy-8-phosphooctulonate synthase [Paracoccus sp. (in: a-proteobacteria)]MCS5600799.1 3-deoxy-8-phosphooctulonate synthase [Paracoccus sp. (in: a-proteobacteria)]|tara:strand:+ start:3089 stop:3931 length:843 start_codon:yes stop_codon:yes gene_type:complete
MTTSRHIRIGPVTCGNDLPLTLIAGPCQLESLEHALMIAESMAEACRAAGAGFVFKASYDKANRTSLSGRRGLGIEEGLAILETVRDRIGCPVLTDVHDAAQAVRAARSVDVIQIPAFLCRQTDLLLAAGRTGAVVNVKKGQFLAPWDMANVAQKVASTGNDSILLTERGVSFGYNTLVADMRSLPIMARSGYPVIMDATHSVQQPGGQGGSSGGQREFAPVMARAAVSLGVAGVFIETHEDPDNAPSDGPNMVPLQQMPALIASLMAFDRLAKADPLTS